MPPPSTTNIVEIGSIRDNVVFLQDGSVRSIVEVSSTNFELRSQDEQNAILQSFQSFLNSLDFSVQFIIQSRRYDIQTYIANVEQATATLKNELLKLQAQEYARFIAELSTLANIMSKKFYVSVSLATTQARSQKEKATGTGGVGGLIKGLFGKSGSKQNAAGLSEQEFTAFKTQLDQRVGLVVDGIASVGLKAKLLASDELVSLFKLVYNPEVPPSS